MAAKKKAAPKARLKASSSSRGVKPTRKAAGGSATKRKAAPTRKTSAPAAEKGLKKKALEKPQVPATPPAPRAAEDPALKLARRVAGLMAERKAENVVILDVTGLASFADFLVLGSAMSERQVSAVARNVAETLKHEGTPPVSVEGEDQSHWVLVDFGGVVAHVFYGPARDYYDLEGHWSDATRIEVRDDAGLRKAAERQRAHAEDF